MELKDTPWPEKNKISETNEYIVFKCGFPVTKGALLIVPKENTHSSIVKCFEAARIIGEQQVQEGYCDSYNIGMNCGQSAGQTIMYPHVHMIPRRAGDCEDPTGGVRNVIPGQGNYRGSTYVNPEEK